jgi:hypothetical protein
MSNYHLRSTVLVLHLYLLPRNYHRESLGTLYSNLVMVSLMCNEHRQCVTLYKCKQRVYNIMTGVAVINSIKQCLIFFLHLHVVHTQLTNCTYYLAFQFWRCSHYRMPIQVHVTRTISHGRAVQASTILCHVSSRWSTHSDLSHLRPFVSLVASTRVCASRATYGAADSIPQTTGVEEQIRLQFLQQVI